MFNGKPQSPCDGILLGLLDLPDLLAPFARLLLLLRLTRVSSGSVCFGVPCKITALSPAAYRRLDAVAEIVFAMCGCDDVIPAEVDAAAGACFSDGGKEIHRCEMRLLRGGRRVSSRPRIADKIRLGVWSVVVARLTQRTKVAWFGDGIFWSKLDVALNLGLATG